MICHVNFPYFSFFDFPMGLTMTFPPPFNRRRVSPDVVCFGAAVSACEKGQQWTHALQLLTERQRSQSGGKTPGGDPGGFFFFGGKDIFV